MSSEHIQCDKGLDVGSLFWGVSRSEGTRKMRQGRVHGIELSTPGITLRNHKEPSSEFSHRVMGNLQYNSTSAHLSLVEVCLLRVLSSYYFQAAFQGLRKASSRGERWTEGAIATAVGHVSGLKGYGFQHLP